MPVAYDIVWNSKQISKFRQGLQVWRSDLENGASWTFDGSNEHARRGDSNSGIPILIGGL